jgi:hypothetical protein
MTEIQEQVERIISGHRRGLRDRMQTLRLLTIFYDQLEENPRGEFCEYLAYLFRTESLSPKMVSMVPPNVPVVTLMMLASVCKTEHLPDLIFSRIQVDDARSMLDWTEHICPIYEYCLLENSDRFDDRALQRTRDLSKEILSSDKNLVLPLITALGTLERCIQKVEFDRFEQSLVQASKRIRSESSDELKALLTELNLDLRISEAMKTADDYLHGGGEFKETIAAGLLRSSIDVTHRAIVSRLEILKKMPYNGADLDRDRRAFLYEAGFITLSEKQFFGSIYTLISQEASHKLIAPKETVLVLQATVNNYLLLFLRRLRNLASTKP